jgi:putative cell wall-binding protein
VTHSRRRASIAVLTAVAVATSLAFATPAVARTPDEPGASDAPLTAAAAGTVTGRIMIELPNGGTVAANSGYVALYSLSSSDLIPEGAASLTSSGTFAISGLAAGDYIAEFRSTDTRAPYVREWFGNGEAQTSGQTFTLIEGAPYAFGDIVLETRSIFVARYFGSDRYATAARLSEVRATDGADRHIVIVNGADYPDALSAGPLTNSKFGHMLMVTTSAIPAATAAELNRLDPTAITIVGGTGVVSLAVEQQLRAYVSSPSLVTRISGSNRYATSRAVLEAFSSAPNELFIATGTGFADALAAGPAAGVVGGGVLLVNGSAPTLDAATLALVEELDVPVTIVGGTGSVSAGIEQALDALAVPVRRVAGSSRFSTAIAIAVEYFPTADYAFVSNAYGFADALAAGPFAGDLRAPLYLSPRDCLPGAVGDDILAIYTNNVFLVGGPGVLGAALDDLTVCP